MTEDIAHKRVTFRGNKLWMAEKRVFGNVLPLAHYHHVNPDTGFLNHTICTSEPAFAMVYFGINAVAQFGNVIGLADEIVDGWPAEETE
jgi:hypothetical protein